MEALWLAVGSVAAALTTLGFVPQVIKMWRTKSVGDLSALTFAQFFAGVTLWTFYGFHLGDPVVLVSNFVMLGNLLVAIVLFARYRRRGPG
ncbi:MAG: hypothetical protein EXR49_02285 [Dehalococcoidia bacterium]|nr:hypothetical protein [Dehalococcoidia bacterium]